MQRLLNLTSVQPTLLARAFYFCYFAAMSSLIPFLALYYAQIGLSGRQIGFLAGILPLITLVSAALWGGVADATHQHRRTLTLVIGGAWIAVLTLSLITRFFWLIPVVAVYAVFSAPIIPLVDNTVIAMLGQRKAEYGRQRLWGAVGWGIAAPISGALIEDNGLGWAFYGYLVMMSGCFVVSTRLPVSHARIGAQFWRGIRSLASNQRWTVFLLTVLVGFLGLSFSVTFLFLYVSELGGSTTLMGLALTVSTLSELPVWFFSDRMLGRWGTRGVLAVALLAAAVQAFAYSLVQVPWQILPIQLLHGPVFSAMWAAGVAYASDIAPPGLGATAQSVFSGVAMSLRSALGAFMGGVLYDGFGAQAMFRWGSVAALLALVFFLIAGSGRKKRRER
jgi:PPP family 3-phenylpropionic acid transporter